MVSINQYQQRTAIPSCVQDSCAISAFLGCMLFVRPFSVFAAALALPLALRLLGLLPGVPKHPGTMQA